jgi:phosphatidylglycerol lysyltransferase
MIKSHDSADTVPLEQCVPACYTATELIRYYGSHALSFFGLAAENKHFLAPDGAGLVNYQRIWNVAVVLGDPVCAPEAREQVMRNFLDFCAHRHWRVAFYQASSERLTTYRVLKLHAFKMGEEAILSPQTFTLKGSAMANVRTTCRRAEREEVQIHWYEGVPPAQVMQQLKDVSNAWLKRKDGMSASEMSFSMGKLDELIPCAERAETIAAISTLSSSSAGTVPRFVTGVVTTRSGQACAFVTFTPIYGVLASTSTAADRQPESQGWGWALDLMRRSPDAPPGVIELLLVRAIERFRVRGAHVVSLGLVAMTDTRREMTAGQRRLLGYIADHLRVLESRHTLFKFKQKFHPCWESRYLVTNTTFALPKIALAVFRLRNYSKGKLARLVMKRILS